MQVSEETTRAAAALYLELKRCMKIREFKLFQKHVADAVLFCEKIKCKPKVLFDELANLHDNEGKNILHNAAV